MVFSILGPAKKSIEAVPAFLAPILEYRHHYLRHVTERQGQYIFALPTEP
jgi:hypothetical protein